MIIVKLRNTLEKIMASPAVILSLAILAPVTFMLCNNWFRYSFRELFVSFLVLTLVCSLIFVVGHFVYSRLDNRISGKSRVICGFVFCVFFAEVFLFCLELPLQGTFVFGNFFTKSIIAGFVIAFILCSDEIKFEFRLAFKAVKIFLVTWLFISIGSGIYSIVSTSVFGEEKLLDESERIKLVERPNIYLFILESYHDLKTMRDAYGINTEPLQSYALSHDFSIYENVYSNSPVTLGSMADIFSMRLNMVKGMGLHDIVPIGRELIGGGLGNQVYRILKENGYRTIYLTTDVPFDYIRNKGIYLDETDADFGFKLASAARPLCELVPRLNRYCYPTDKGSIEDIRPRFRNSLGDNIRMIIDESKNLSPFFIGFKSGAKHSPSRGTYTWKQKDEWVSSGEYQEAIDKGNQELSEIVDLVVEKDPSAVIVLIGDHGSWRLRNIWNDSAKDIAKLEQILIQNGESLDSLAHDIFGTFLAILMPGKGDISKGLPMSHVNVFRHIFAALADGADSDAILQRRALSESNLYGIKLVKDGIVQRPENP